MAIITGAGSGIGRATAILFAREGAKIIVVDINVKGGEETVRMIRNLGGEATFVRADVSKAEDAENMIKTAIKTYGKLDILHNNAGISIATLGDQERDTVTDLSEENWDKIMSVNLKGIFLCSKYAIPEMMKWGGGVIINTASECGLVGCPLAAAYSASKGGIILLTKQMALEYAPYNIRVNCICPCNVETPMTEKDFSSLDPDRERTLQAITNVMPLGRLGKPEEIAYAALYLASDEASFTTGSVLVVDGGVTAGGTHTYWKPRGT